MGEKIDASGSSGHGAPALPGPALSLGCPLGPLSIHVSTTHGVSTLCQGSGEARGKQQGLKTCEVTLQRGPGHKK